MLIAALGQALVGLVSNLSQPSFGAIRGQATTTQSAEGQPC
jgi:hypothetical protein